MTCAFGSYIKAMETTFGNDASTYIGKLQEYLSCIELANCLTVLIGHRPYKNTTCDMAFCPTNSSHTTGRTILDTAYRLHGYSGFDCQHPDMYGLVEDFWDRAAHVSINLWEVREYIRRNYEGDDVMLSKAEVFEEALIDDLLEDYNGTLVVFGTNQFSDGLKRPTSFGLIIGKSLILVE